MSRASRVTAIAFYACVLLSLVLQVVVYNLINSITDGGYHNLIHYMGHTDYFYDTSDDEVASPVLLPGQANCTHEKLGPSGTVQRIDVQCSLDVNQVSEQVLVAMYVWQQTVMTLVFFYLIKEGLIYAVPSLRR